MSVLRSRTLETLKRTHRNMNWRVLMADNEARQFMLEAHLIIVYDGGKKWKRLRE